MGQGDEGGLPLAHVQQGKGNAACAAVRGKGAGGVCKACCKRGAEQAQPQQYACRRRTAVAGEGCSHKEQHAPVAGYGQPVRAQGQMRAQPSGLLERIQPVKEQRDGQGGKPEAPCRHGLRGVCQRQGSHLAECKPCEAGGERDHAQHGQPEQVEQEPRADGVEIPDHHGQHAELYAQVGGQQPGRAVAQQVPEARCAPRNVLCSMGQPPVRAGKGACGVAVRCLFPVIGSAGRLRCAERGQAAQQGVDGVEQQGQREHGKGGKLQPQVEQGERVMQRDEGHGHEHAVQQHARAVAPQQQAPAREHE